MYTHVCTWPHMRTHTHTLTECLKNMLNLILILFSIYLFTLRNAIKYFKLQLVKIYMHIKRFRGSSRNRGVATYTVSPNDAEPGPPPNRGTPASIS